MAKTNLTDKVWLYLKRGFIYWFSMGILSLLETIIIVGATTYSLTQIGQMIIAGGRPVIGLIALVVINWIISGAILTYVVEKIE